MVQYKDAQGQPQAVPVAGDENEVTVPGLDPDRKYKMNLYGLRGRQRVGPESVVAKTGESWLPGLPPLLAPSCEQDLAGAPSSLPPPSPSQLILPKPPPTSSPTALLSSACQVPSSSLQILISFSASLLHLQGQVLFSPVPSTWTHPSTWGCPPHRCPHHSVTVFSPLSFYWAPSWSGLGHGHFWASVTCCPHPPAISAVFRGGRSK